MIKALQTCCGRIGRAPRGGGGAEESALAKQTSERIVLGWREWVSLPLLGIDRIKAKIDTGARTSALHGFKIEAFEERGVQRVRFLIHPVQHDVDTVLEWSDIVIGPHRWPAELTLTSRDDMLFRMLLGRTAMSGKAVVDPARSFLVGKKDDG